MKIFVLSGKTMSGKTTVADILEKEHNISRVKSFTTRPIREDEIDGKDYNFYEDSIALTLILMGKTSAVRLYQPHESFGPYPWYYGFETTKIRREKVPFLITDLGGIYDLQKEFGEENVFSIYLDIDEEEQSKRLSKRGKELEHEQLRRIKADINDFAGIEDSADHIIKATKQPAAIAKEIMKLIEKNS